MGLVVIDLITSPVVSWRGWETPPPPPPSTVAQLSFFAQPPACEDLSLSCGDLLLSSARLLFTFGGCLTGILSLVDEYFPFFLSLFSSLCRKN